MSVPLIDLKRFKVDSFRRDKIESNVKFPLTSLKLHSSTLSSLECSSLTSSKEEILYDLYGVSNHMGGLGGGHYVAHVLGQGNQWYLMDDSQVSLVGPQLQGNMPSAYVLFYKKRRS
jgi:ubiquitin C-terminal hydrolase